MHGFRIGAMLALVLAGSARAQLDDARFSVTVTRRTPATGIEKLVAGIAQETGVPLRVAAGMRGDIVVVAVDKLPARDLLARIAEAAGGRWQLQEGVPILLRDDAVTKADEGRERALRIDRLQRELRRIAPPTGVDAAKTVAEARDLAQQLNRPAGNPQGWERFEKLVQLTPGNRLAVKLLQSIGPAVLADIVPGQRVVFATNPTPMQRPLGSSGDAALRAYAKESMAWKTALASIPEDQVGSLGALADMSQADAGPPARALLVVSCQEGSAISMRQLGVLLIVVDRNGNRNGRGSVFLDPAAVDDEPPAGATDTTPIELSASALRLQGWLRNMLTGDEEAPFEASAEMRAFFAEPDKNELLAGLVSEGLLTLASSSGRPLVAVVPDQAITATLDAPPRPTLGWFRTQMEPLLAFRDDGANGWLVRPTMPVSARRDRVDRAKLTSYLRRFVAKTPTLEDAGEFALQFGANYDGVHFLCLTGIGVTQPMFQEWNALRLFGLLSPAQRQGLIASGRLEFRAMTAPQRAVASAMVFGAEGHIEPEGDENFDGETFYLGLASEPTEALPNGLPAVGYLRMNLVETPILFTTRQFPGRREYTMPEPLESVAWQLFAKDRPDLFPFANENTLVDRYRVGSQREFTLTLQLGPKLKTEGRLADAALAKDATALPLDKLPEALKKRLFELIQNQRRAYENVRPDQVGGDGGKPPPR